MKRAGAPGLLILTGGTVISEEKGYKLENATLDYRGMGGMDDMDF